MAQKTAVLVLLMFFFSFAVSASSQHGNFEGNPVVKLIADGTELKADDVPAIIYNNRTMVPIYLLQQLGFDVKWNQENYSVLVKSPVAGNTAEVNQDQALMEQVLQYLNDFDYSMILFVEKLKFYSEVENFTEYKPQWELDFEQLEKRSRDVNLNALKINETLNSDVIWNALKNQTTAVQLVKNSKDFLSFWAENPQNTNYKKNFQQSLLSSMKAVHQNYENTKDAQHELFLKKINLH